MKLVDPFEQSFFVGVALIFSYAVFAAAAIIFWMWMITNAFSPFPYGLPALVSPCAVVILWKGISRS